MNEIDKLLDRVLGPIRQQEIEEQKKLESIINRLTHDDTQQEIDRLLGRTTPRIGHGPGTYTPLAKATGCNLISLFIPEFAFTDWESFRSAREQAITWLRNNRWQVEDSVALMWGNSFSLDDTVTIHRATDGTIWYNAAIATERDYYAARVQARE